MKFRCKACGEIFPAMKWNNALRNKAEELDIDSDDFLPIQNNYKDDIKWYCPNCSENTLDVKVKKVD